MILAIVGTRQEPLRRAVLERVRGLADEFSVYATGCCPTGVDALVRREMVGRRVVIVVYAPWDALGKSAGPVRNARIAQIADQCLAIPEADERPGSGTWDCVHAFEALCKPVEIFGEWKRMKGCAP